jgi:hypothetical protein
VQEPPFEKFTAMRIKRRPSVEEVSTAYDCFINMNNVFIDQAIKEKPKRLQEIRDRYKFGMTIITLAVIRHDLEIRKRQVAQDEDEEDEPKRPDVHNLVAEVTSAIAPFLLPLGGQPFPHHGIGRASVRSCGRSRMTSLSVFRCSKTTSRLPGVLPL